MTEENFKINSIPVFQDVICPIHKTEMVELDNGWFSTAWWCRKCEKPYKLKLMPIRKFDRNAVNKQLEEK